jgi:hypothetical protein
MLTGVKSGFNNVFKAVLKAVLNTRPYDPARLRPPGRSPFGRIRQEGVTTVSAESAIGGEGWTY